MGLFRRKERTQSQMFSTKSHAWREAGLSDQISQKAIRRARRQIIAITPALIAVLLLYSYREELFGKEFDRPARIITVIALVILGWAFARDIGRAAAPSLFRRMDPGTAGTVGFLIRLATVGLTVLVALRIAGLEPRTLAVGGAFTAVILGLAAQQTLGNLFAGTVLLSARPFRVGERVRFQGSGIEVDGVVSALGLLYTTMASGDDTIMIPNSVILNLAVTPLREPDAVDMRARLRVGVKPSDVQQLLKERVSVRTKTPPRINLEEVDGDEVVVRILATPELAADGPRLADEVLLAIHEVTASDGNGASVTRVAHPPAADGEPEVARPAQPPAADR